MRFGGNKGKLFITMVLVLISAALRSQTVYFTDTDESAISKDNIHRAIVPQQYRTVSLDNSALKNFLWSLPEEQSLANRNTAPVLSLPMPDGTIAKFRVWEYSMMEPELVARYPDIKTFAGYGIDDPYAVLRMDYNTLSGFSAQILSVNGDVYIDPYARGDAEHCISYYAKDHQSLSVFHCLVQGDTSITNKPENIESGYCRGTVLYTYRLAVACTGEYATAVSAPNPPSTAAAMAAIVTTINRVNAVYEKELAMRFLLVANNNLLVFLNPATDPYTNGNATAMMDENQATVNSVIGFSNYDAGHVFGTGNMSMAALAAVCSSPNKAKAVSGLPNPTGDLFDVERVCHNMGHLFGSQHTYNSNNANCTEGPAIPGVEPGSGTTIMAAAGSCGPDMLQPQADPFFNTFSFWAITQFIVSNAAPCRNIIPNGGNVPPRIISMPIIGFNIPQATPFTLNAVATDDNGDPITYCWETTDRGPVGPWNGGNTVGSPFFKSRVPKTTGSRTFPDIDVILAGYPANPPPVQGGLKGETLPQITAGINFRLTVRDNRGGVINDGADCHNALFQIGVYAAPGTGPFKVNLPDGGETWSSNSQQTILWDVAGTTGALINTQWVNILLSTDGGYTYPFTLAATVPNDGFEVVTMQNISSTTARIKVEAVQNIFFDISNGNFSIAPAPVGFEFGNPNMQSVACPGPATVVYTLGTVSNGGYNTPVNLSATGVPPGATISFGTNPVVPGSASTLTINNVNTIPSGIYYITINGTSGSLTRTRVLVLQVQTGAAAPVITMQPQSITDCIGANVTFTVAATGALTYQWQSAAGPGFPFINITPNGNAASYTLNNISFALNNYRYRCIVTGQCNTTVSSEAVLTIQAGPSIVSQPQSAAVCAGRAVTFSVTFGATSYTPLFQWQVNSGGGFINIGGAVSRTLTLTNVATAMDNNQYRCLVLNPNCSTPTISDFATLTVYPLPVVSISAAPYTKLLPGLQTTLTATATVTPGAFPFSYRWSWNGGLLTGFTGNTYTVGINRLGSYRAEVTEARGCFAQSLPIMISDSASGKLFILPNPARHDFTVYFYNPGGTSTTRQIILYNSAGVKILSDRVTVSGAYPIMLYNVRTLAKGIYHVVLSDAAGKVLAKGKLLVH